MKRKHKVKIEFRTATMHGARKRIGWHLLDGYGLPKNNFGWLTYYNKVDGCWYLIEGRTGYAVGKGSTMLAAIARFLSDEVRTMTWCAKAANLPEIASVPLLDAAE